MNSAEISDYPTATVEYAADIDLPDGIFTHPAVTAVLDSLVDVAVIQNVCLSCTSSQVPY